ncbi:hypothetical protein ACJJTC_006623 [Scirpophaga incertulas]
MRSNLRYSVKKPSARVALERDGTCSRRRAASEYSTIQIASCARLPKTAFRDPVIFIFRIRREMFLYNLNNESRAQDDIETPSTNLMDELAHEVPVYCLKRCESYKLERIA